MRPKVKICGITNLEDALLACELGANAVGFIFYPKSPRYILPDKAQAICESLPPFVTKVGVFVNCEPKEVKTIARHTELNLVQLHGEETPEYCIELQIPYIKAFRVRQDFDISSLRQYNSHTFLLDAFSEKSYGGTGETFDWNIAKAAKKYGKIILSGGLTPENIGKAILQVQPYAVDIASGVEISPGKKSPEKLQALFQEIEAIE